MFSASPPLKAASNSGGTQSYFPFPDDPDDPDDSEDPDDPDDLDYVEDPFLFSKYPAPSSSRTSLFP